ncbi:hypothetical protein CVIRNUC_007138 [Coccomyxa viridis]|uniref:Protein kinase domain-containing protein n=1 Tax=Coccomyxa viridis TaxID=1274662 RepID=A0AAV1ID44_9CHLO|nr:hypothetical protein CVIRNUC_007138 [Coccomyxa viridis]
MARKCLTVPSEGRGNDGHDNEHNDLILNVDDVLSSGSRRYIVRDLLGQGTFGQVVRCVREDSREDVAVKVIKNQTAFYHQARVEVGVLQFLNTRGDPDNKHHIVRMRDFFMHCSHLCLVFELLSVNLYELVKHNQFRGLSMNLLRFFILQILDALSVLCESNIIHCDLKPENVLLKGLDSGDIKVIDFGSACFENRTMYSYIQSRFYRSPEVLLGYPYTVAIDMWSLGCMAAELFLGLPLFPGASEHDLLVRIVEMLGPPPGHVLAKAQHTKKYFERCEALASSASGAPISTLEYKLRTQAEFEAANGVKAPAGKRYFQHTQLHDIVGSYPFRSGLADAQLAEEKNSREAFLDFLLGVLDLDPSTRWTPRQALQHPFITQQRFTGPFQPAPARQERGQPMRGQPGRPGASPYDSSMSSMYHSPMAAMLATSPEFHAQAHAAAMAALQAHFSPGGAALGAPLQSSLQTVDPQIAAAAAAAAARYNPQVQQNGVSHQQSVQLQQPGVDDPSGIPSQALQNMQFGPLDFSSGVHPAQPSHAEGTPYGTPYSSVGGFSSLQSTPHSLTGYSPLTHFHGSLGSSHLGTPARSMPSASMQNTPLAASYNSYSLMAAAAAAAHSSGQGLNSQPIGSLEALRATWHPPHMHGQQPQSSYGLYGQGSSSGQLQSSFLSSLQQLQQEHNRLYPLEAQNNKWLSPTSGSSSSEAKPSRARRNLDQGRGLSASHSLDRQGSGLDRSAHMDVYSSQAQHDAAGAPPGFASSGNGTQRAPVQSIAVQESQVGWPASALESSASVPQPDEGPASLGERQQQQYWQAFTQSVGRAPDPGGASPARAGQQDARWRSSPGHAPQQPLEAVPEGEESAMSRAYSALQGGGIAASSAQPNDVGPQPSDWDPSYSDDQLLANEDSGWGAYLEGRQRQAARSAAIPRPPDPADLPSSYAESMTSPAQPSPQGPYDTRWLRTRGEAGAPSTRVDPLQAQIGFTPIKEGVPQVPGAAPSQLLQALQSHAGPHGHLGQSSAYRSDVA